MIQTNAAGIAIENITIDALPATRRVMYTTTTTKPNVFSNAFSNAVGKNASYTVLLSKIRTTTKRPISITHTVIENKEIVNRIGNIGPNIEDF